MIKRKRKSFKKAFCDYVDATLEPNFSPEDLLSEIHPLLTEYFRGNFEKSKNKILCSFLNGQKFEITAAEIKSTEE